MENDNDGPLEQREAVPLNNGEKVLKGRRTWVTSVGCIPEKTMRCDSNFVETFRVQGSPCVCRTLRTTGAVAVRTGEFQASCIGVGWTLGT